MSKLASDLDNSLVAQKQKTPPKRGFERSGTGSPRWLQWQRAQEALETPVELGWSSAALLPAVHVQEDESLEHLLDLLPRLGREAVAAVGVAEKIERSHDVPEGA